MNGETQTMRHRSTTKSHTLSNMIADLGATDHALTTGTAGIQSTA